MTAAMLTFLYPTVGRLVLPLVAIVPFVIFAAADDETLPIFLVTLGIAGAVALFVYLIARSEESARRLGDWASRTLSQLLNRLHREPLGSFGPAVVRFRTDTLASVRGNWKLAVLAVSSNFLIISLILLLSLRFIGLSDAELPWVEILAAFALSQWAQTIIPISPGGLGIADAVLLACLAAVAPGNSDAIVAALVLWRVFYWALPIPVGLVAIQRWKRENPHGIEEAKAVFIRSRHGDGEGAQPEAS